MGNESEDLQDVVNMTGYPRVCKPALDAQTLAELEFAIAHDELTTLKRSFQCPSAGLLLRVIGGPCPVEYERLNGLAVLDGHCVEPRHAL
jgi:hypothetical protein